MKRYMFPGIFALATIAVALTACPATAQDLPFKATLTGSPAPVARHGKYYEFNSSGTGTYLGTCTKNEYVDFKNDGTATGYGIITSATGDELYISFSVQFVGPGWYIGTCQFTGGAGRFANAAGAGDFEVKDDLSAGIAHHYIEGTITF